MRSRSRRSAKALLLTILGEFVLPRGGSAWTATLVESLGAVGVAERSARQALARLKEQGLLDSERHGRRTRWNLSPAGQHLLTVGSDRIYRFGVDRGGWDRHWLVVHSPVPERQRAKRHQLRGQLEFAGFGFLGAGVALSPHVDREDAANTVLRDLGLIDTAVVFRAEVGSLLEPEELLRRAWDLDAIAAGYDEFIAGFGTLAPTDAGATFAALVTLVDEWRRFPFGDPELPGDLLPATWPGRRARHLFEERRAEWAPAASRWFDGKEAAAELRS
jgi:phenylacetic acid degradation operon negative regulatory protein